MGIETIGFAISAFVVLLPVLWMISCFIKATCELDQNGCSNCGGVSTDRQSPIFNIQPALVIPGEVRVYDQPPPSYEEVVMSLPQYTTIFNVETETETSQSKVKTDT